MLRHETSYKELFAFLKEPALILDSDCRIREVNAAAQNLLKYHRKEWLSENLNSIISGQDDINCDVLANYPEVGMKMTLTSGSNEKIPIILWIIRTYLDGAEYYLCTLKDERSTTVLSDTLIYRLKVEELISKVSSRFLNIADKDIDQAIIITLQETGALVDTDRSYVYLYDGDHYVNTHEWVAEGVSKIMDIQNAEDPDDFGWIHDQLKKNEVVHIPDIDSLKGEHDLLRERLKFQGIKSTLAVPILTSSADLTGFLGFDNFCDKKYWSNEDIGLLKVVGEVLANALERQAYEKRLKQANIELLELTARQEKLIRERTQSLVAANRQLVDAVKELDHFVYRAAHDLKGPIKRFLGLINLAKYECKELQSKGYLDLFQDTAKGMDRGLSKLLTINEISTHIPQSEPINMSTLVDECLTTISEYLDYSEVDIILPEESLTVDGSYYLLKVALTNIMENALFFGMLGRGATIVKVDYNVIDDHLKIKIYDNGIGISEEVMPRVNDMFYRASNESIGNGLGLYLADKALEKLHGKMSLESVEGRYTSCSLTIPI